MKVSQINKIEKTIESLGYGNALELALDNAQMLIMGKIERFQNELNYFEKKYNCSYSEHRKNLNKLKEENFDLEDESMDWEYAVEGLKFFKSKLKDIER